MSTLTLFNIFLERIMWEALHDYEEMFLSLHMIFGLERAAVV